MAEPKKKTGAARDWFHNQLLQWRREVGYEKKAVDWAVHLEVPYSTLAAWMRGVNDPDERNAKRLAEKTGDYSIFEILGYVRPNPRLEELSRLFDQATPDQQDEILRQALRLMGYEKKE